MLTYHQRKERLPFGAQRRVAESLGYDEGHVSAVVKGTRRNPDIERALYRLMTKPKPSLRDTFGPLPLTLRRSMRAERAARGAA